jgi:hypothetical protein
MENVKRAVETVEEKKNTELKLEVRRTKTQIRTNVRAGGHSRSML